MNSSGTANTSKAELDTNKYFYNYEDWVYSDKTTPKIVAWIIPLLVVMALFGNIFIVIVMNKPSNRVLACSVFFTALAVSDILFVLQISLERWFAIALSIDFYSSTNASLTTKIKAIATNSNIHISIWLLVAVMVERLLCVVVPHKVKFLLTKTKAKVIVAGVCVCNILMNSLLIGITLRVVFVEQIGIIISDAIPYGADISTWNDFIHGFALPFLLITSGTIVIVVCLYRRNIQGSTASSDRAMSATKNLLEANISFLVTYSPEKIFNIILTYDNNVFTINHDRLFHIFLLLADVNAALNFFLYVLSGSRFRADVFELFKRSSPTVSSPVASAK